MEKLKTFLLLIAVMVFVFGCVYLLGSFYNTSFNIRIWAIESLRFVAIVGGLLSFVSGAATLIYKHDIDSE